MTRVLVFRLSALGDVIHTIPAVALLKGADVSWVVEAPYAELVHVVTGVETIPVRFKKWGRSPWASRNEMRHALARMRGAELSIDFQGLVKSAMLGTLAGVKTRVGFSGEAVREKPALLFTNEQVKVDTSKHVVDQNIELATHVLHSLAPRQWGEGRGEGQSASSPHPDPLPARGERGLNWQAFPQPLSCRPAKYVLLPGAGKPNKLWPVERFRELASRLGDVLVVWGPGEAERAQAIGARIAPPTNLRELAWLLEKAEVVIGGDTGPLHLAAALGTKVVGLYGPTDPRRNGPYGQLHRVVDESVNTKLMDSITVETVMTLVEKVASE